MKLKTFSILFLLFMNFGILNSQIKVTFIENDCIESPNKELCQEVSQRFAFILDSLAQHLDYTYVPYRDNLEKSNLILAKFFFKKQGNRNTIKFSITDALTNKEITYFGASPAHLFTKVLQYSIVQNISSILSARIVSPLKAQKQQYLTEVNVFFSFDKINFDVDLPKNIKEEIYIMAHNVFVEKQSKEVYQFNFLSRYSDPSQIEKKDNTKLQIFFEPIENDKDKCKIRFVVRGKSIDDALAPYEDKITDEFIVDLGRIKKQDYTDLLSKLYKIGSWIFANY